MKKNTIVFFFFLAFCFISHSQCGDIYGTTSVKVTIIPDRYGAETTWQIEDSFNIVIASGGPYATIGLNQTQPAEVQNVNLPVINECYTFTISDSYGDGICCLYGAGSYMLEDENDNIMTSGGGFGGSESYTFEAVAPFINLTKQTDNFSISGNSVTVSATIENIGTVDSGAFDVRFYASTNTIISTADIPIYTENVGSLIASGTTTVGSTIDLCAAGLTNGIAYYVGYIIDYSDSVTESNEIDNTFVFNSTIASGCLLGDVNEDSTVNVLDALILSDFLFNGGSSNFNMALADADESGLINVADVVAISQIILSPASGRTSRTSTLATSNTKSVLGANNYLTTIDQSAMPNTPINIEIAMDNGDTIKGIQFDFALPAGFTLDPNLITETARLSNMDVIAASAISPNNYRVLAFSIFGNSVTLNNGVILNVPVTIGASVTNGVYPIPYTDVILAQDGNTNYQTPAPSVGEITIQTLGLEDFNTTDNVISLYPNPSSETIFFKSSTAIEAVKIFDVNGKMVLESTYYDTGISIKNLSNGVYFVKAISKDNNQTFKLIKN